MPDAKSQSPVAADEQQPSEALSVSSALALAKGSLESLVVRVIGEVSEVSVKPGYKAAYFTVKDSGASMPCMMWNNRYRAQGVDLSVGQLVELTGRFTLYAAKGRMNFDVFSISLTGEGELRMRVAAIAKKLKAEGLTDPASKRALPAFPERIGLVTSPRSAAVHDVLRTLRRRFPCAQVLLAGVGVEGAKASADVAEGVRCVAEAGAEVVLVVRGGGSFEDLMPFNDESLARAIAACPVPVVTGIGHEVDTTIADMVSDFRASTPTAAAEAVSCAREQLESGLQARAGQMASGLSRRLDRTDAYLKRIEDKPLFADPMLLFASDAQRIDGLNERLERVLPDRIGRAGAETEALAKRLELVGPHILERFGHQVGGSASRLADLSPVNTLARGYSITKDETGTIVKSVQGVTPGESLVVTLADGTVSCEVESVDGTPPYSY